MSLLKVNWTKTTLGEVAKWSSGGTPKRTNNDYYGGSIPWVKTGDLGDRVLNQSSEFITEEGLKNSSAKLFPKGSLGLAMYGATIGKVSIFGIEAACNQACAVAVPDYEKIHTDFLYYLLKNEKEAFIKKGKGGAQPNISQTIIKAHEIAIPAIEEQKRIADKLDSVLAKVEAAQARLDKIPAILKRFRQSVLAAATSGELTKEWREENSNLLLDKRKIQLQRSNIYKRKGRKYVEAEGIGGEILDKLFDIPDSWSWLRAEEFCDFITKGTTPKRDRMGAEFTVPYIKVYNLTFDGSLDFTIEPTFVDKLTHDSELKRSIVYPGDVLMNIVGPPLGKVSIVPDEYPEWNINQAIAVFRPVDAVNNQYLSFCLQSTRLLELVKLQAKATAGQFNLTLEICRNYPLPVPHVKEQEVIVKKVEELFEYAGAVDKQYQAAKKRLDKLTQSLLAKAFKGEILPSLVDSNIEAIENSVEAIHA